MGIVSLTEEITTRNNENRNRISTPRMPSATENAASFISACLNSSEELSLKWKESLTKHLEELSKKIKEGPAFSLPWTVIREPKNETRRTDRLLVNLVGQLRRKFSVDDIQNRGDNVIQLVNLANRTVGRIIFINEYVKPTKFNEANFVVLVTRRKRKLSISNGVLIVSGAVQAIPLATFLRTHIIERRFQ